MDKSGLEEVLGVLIDVLGVVGDLKFPVSIRFLLSADRAAMFGD